MIIIKILCENIKNWNLTFLVDCFGDSWSCMKLWLSCQHGVMVDLIDFHLIHLISLDFCVCCDSTRVLNLRVYLSIVWKYWMSTKQTPARINFNRFTLKSQCIREISIRNLSTIRKCPRNIRSSRKSSRWWGFNSIFIEVKVSMLFCKF